MVKYIYIGVAAQSFMCEYVCACAIFHPHDRHDTRHLRQRLLYCMSLLNQQVNSCIEETVWVCVELLAEKKRDSDKETKLGCVLDVLAIQDLTGLGAAWANDVNF